MAATLLVFLGAGIGGALRHAVQVGCTRLCGTAFPWGTLAVNVAGSLAMGVLAGFVAGRGEEGGQALRLFLMTGVLGGFTTFSAFSLDTMLLAERGEAAAAVGYVAASLAGSVGALALGLGAARAVA